MRRGVLIAALLAVLAGCQQAPPPEPPKPTKAPAVVLREEGDALAAKGDHAGAAAKYETALASTPADLSLRFVLGSTYSHLNRRADAVAQFQHVVAGAARTSPEYQSARQWLVSVGALREEPAAASTSPGSTSDARSPTAAGPQTGLSGTLEWKGIAQGTRRVPVRLTLTGEDFENRSVRSLRAARLGEKYAFPNIAPGSYRLVVIAIEPREQPLWDVRVTVEKDKPTVLNLNSATAAISPDTFPGPE